MARYVGRTVSADRRLVEIFNKNGIKGTFHLNSAHLGNPGKIEASEVAELYKGHEISCHTYTHPFPNTMPREALIDEICNDRKALESIAGYPVIGMSYPFGEYNQSVIDQFRALGVENERGEIRVGLLADFSLCDGDLNIIKVYKRGVGQLPGGEMATAG